MAGEEHRGARIAVRVTARERNAIRKRAKASGLGVSAYIRRQALAEGRVPSVWDSGALSPLYAEMRRVGNNVNQLARSVNTFGPDAVPMGAIVSAMESLRRATDAVSEELIRSRMGR